ncbi:hypothetical protein [Aquisalinus flavus]|uniref:Uncharacterized protein n=1 Tax=Aquisalinus flavus TaxID=1526572 RepID=A0A8J2V253_9PROT|nr:hypothetical protein [Aquisalinus flavus]MBD0427108.1 hypothetical protein [Aquisalinus flavus]GGC98459.1 hypothetical protein GCM10011342_04220 [Aquisalinus flavus]
MAQTTGGVFGPVVNEGHRSAQYRFGLVPDSNGSDDSIAHRLHYQKAINRSTIGRIVAQANDRPGGGLDFDYLQGQLFWQVTPDERTWQSGFRFDARWRDDNRPGQLGANWTNQIKLSDGWSTRFLVMSAVDVGEDAKDGIYLQTRANIARKFAGGAQAGVEIFNNYGTTEGLGSFEDQSHQIGPFASLPVNKEWSVVGSVLLGMSDAASDTDLRLWVGREF